VHQDVFNLFAAGRTDGYGVYGQSNLSFRRSFKWKNGFLAHSPDPVSANPVAPVLAGNKIEACDDRPGTDSKGAGQSDSRQSTTA